MKARILLPGVMLCLFFVGQVVGQGIGIKGKVISGEDRSGMLGVNILVKHTARGTTTDNNGHFELDNVSSQDTLVFTFIGFQRTEMPIRGRDVINVTLTPQALAGEAVVVIGYGTQQRREVTSAIATLSDFGFTQGAIRDHQFLLQGRVPGVVVTQSSGDLGAAPLIRIRGGTSVSASNEPMIVIDGVPVDNSSSTPGGEGITDGVRDNPLAMVSPADIASIDILKDASAAAIYGARGGNGVIQITTRQGRAGGFSLTYDGYASTSSQSKKLDLLNAQEYQNFAAQVGASLPDPSLTTSTDWQDEAVRTGFSQSHNLSFSSGSELTQYIVSLNYLDEQGIVLGSERSRVSARLNLNHSAFDRKLRLGVRFNPTYIRRNNTPYQQTAGFEGGLFTNIYKMSPTLPVYLSDGSYYEYPSTGIRNPVALAKEIDDISKSMRLFLNTTAEYDVFPSLTGKINLGFDRTEASRDIYQPGSLPYASGFGGLGGRADVKDNTRQNVLFEATGNYRRNIGASQKLEATGGYTFQEFQNRDVGATAQGFVTDAWSFNNLEGGSDFSVRPSSLQSKNRLISFLGRVNYNVSEKYLFSAALRYEGSSRFGVGNKWGTFPALSAGWRLSQEPFMESFGSLSDMKLRLSYGVTGNQDIGDYKSLLILGPGANAVIGDAVRTGVAPTQLANPDLKWEETSQLNFGIDFGFLDDRISGTIDVYNKTTTDLLLEYDVPQPAVVATRLENAGKVTNKGIELGLNTVNISSPGFFWRTSLNFAYNKNEVVDLGDRESIITGIVSGAGLSGVRAQIVLPGNPLGTFFGPRFLGYDSEGNEILSSDAGRPEATTGPLGDGRQILGDAQPDFNLGLSSTMIYKKWDFRFFFQGVTGFSLFNNTRLEYQRPSNVTNGINLLRGALEDVANGMNPARESRYSDRFIEDGSFIRLQNVTLGYTFDAFSNVRSLRAYVSADNLFILTDYQGYDPEVNNFAVDPNDPTARVQTLGIDYANYPRSRTFTFGFSIGM
ncbi:MAG: SusC/RagA family TonB-linked outer membrane protein [bacterium]